LEIGGEVALTGSSMLCRDFLATLRGWTFHHHVALRVDRLVDCRDLSMSMIEKRDMILRNLLHNGPSKSRIDPTTRRWIPGTEVKLFSLAGSCNPRNWDN
jgi:hypothetical protein